MTEWIILGTYVLGFLLVYRHMVGFFLDDFDYEGDGVVLLMSLFLGFLTTFLWPFIVLGRAAYVSWVKWGDGEGQFIQKVFPPPKQVESRYERERRLHAETKDELEILRRWSEREQHETRY